MGCHAAVTSCGSVAAVSVAAQGGEAVTILAHC
jgi:hypothetical protein